jgi:citrate synthase
MAGYDPLTAQQAADLLGVSRATLYAYVSRGIVASEPGPGPSRARRYPRASLEALRARRARGRDPAMAAHGALHWGGPVLDSALTLIEDGRPYYRGRDAVGLTATASVEEVAALLWTGSTAGVGVLCPRRRHPRCTSSPNGGWNSGRWWKPSGVGGYAPRGGAKRTR